MTNLTSLKVTLNPEGEVIPKTTCLRYLVSQGEIAFQECTPNNSSQLYTFGLSTCSALISALMIKTGNKIALLHADCTINANQLAELLKTHLDLSQATTVHIFKSHGADYAEGVSSYQPLIEALREIEFSGKVLTYSDVSSWTSYGITSEGYLLAGGQANTVMFHKGKVVDTEVNDPSPKFPIIDFSLAPARKTLVEKLLEKLR